VKAPSIDQRLVEGLSGDPRRLPLNKEMIERTLPQDDVAQQSLAAR
jgi:hypothetical protein